MTDFQFTPNTFTVPAGQQINFSATNNGGVAHSFVIMKQGSEVNAGFSDNDQANLYQPMLEKFRSLNVYFNNSRNAPSNSVTFSLRLE